MDKNGVLFKVNQDSAVAGAFLQSIGGVRPCSSAVDTYIAFYREK